MPELSGMDFEDREIAYEGIQCEGNLENNLQEETRAHDFLEKRMIALYLELLALSFLHECEVLSAGNCEISGTKKGFKFWETSSGMLLNESLYSRSEALVNLLSCFAEMKLKGSVG